MNFLILKTTLLLYLNFQAPFDWVSFDMEKRINKSGETTKLNAKIYFDRTGDMVSRYSYPVDITIINNKDGELSVYNSETNSVYQTVNYELGSESTTFYYFLKNQTTDMGLRRVGFELSSSKVEGDLLISYWKPPREIEGLADIELVRKNRKPIFLGYRDKKANYIKKVFYYDYEFMRGFNFPMSMTEIDYIENDSIVSKTTFKSFSFDQTSDLEMLKFEIPEDATLEK